MRSIDIQNLAGSPQQARLCYTVVNTGSEGPAGISTFDVGVFFSSDQTLDDGDIQWGRMYAAWTYHLTATFSQSTCLTHEVEGDRRNNRPITPGSYYILVKVDAFPGQAPNRYPGVEESNENNNVGSSSTRLTVN